MRWLILIACLVGAVGCGNGECLGDQKCRETAHREYGGWNAIICTPGAVVERSNGYVYCRCLKPTPAPQPTDEGKDR